MAEKTKKIGPFQRPKGTADILPEEEPYWERIRKVVSAFAHAYGFSRIETPLIEESALFERSVGEATDIVEKQMYTFRTRGGDSLTLRPEGTAPIARVYIEEGMANLPQPVKLYYIGPMFRYEQPQAGRYRQFHQFGVEIIGEQDSASDAQTMQLFWVIFQELGIKKIHFEVNSLGCPQCRPKYRTELKEYYRPKTAKLCPDCRRRLKENPLRLLDCKNERCQELKANAPHLIDHLCQECHNHFTSVLEFLDELEIPYLLNPHLVRGLDYYTKTVFEGKLLSDSGVEESARVQELGGGGRYDKLIELLGGKDTPGVGWAAGVERAILVMKALGIAVPVVTPEPKVFLAQLGDLGKKRSLKLFEELRRAGIPVAESFGRSSIKAQLRIADKLGVAVALILGQKEALDGNIILREMRSGVQEIIPLGRFIEELKKRLKK
ncbi:histidine--tRNA ligase [Candidatus Azambacteria bacterium]|nr:histidine--tRNA ligase [Candidatus Azambacteria bacterium]